MSREQDYEGNQTVCNCGAGGNAGTGGAKFSARAEVFIKDVMLIGGTLDKTDTLRTQYQNEGLSTIVYDLNSNAGGDAIHLYYTKDNSSGSDGTTYSLDPSGTTVIPQNGSPSRFFRLRAAEHIEIIVPVN
ncbi:MAG: hypothetical protein IJH50_11325 [Kiritimatiellae bacterium]|nr:hypothetical protein [Kiritimatiellia bacterium]